MTSSVLNKYLLEKLNIELQAVVYKNLDELSSFLNSNDRMDTDNYESWKMGKTLIYEGCKEFSNVVLNKLLDYDDYIMSLITELTAPISSRTVVSEESIKKIKLLISILFIFKLNKWLINSDKIVLIRKNNVIFNIRKNGTDTNSIDIQNNLIVIVWNTIEPNSNIDVLFKKFYDYTRPIKKDFSEIMRLMDIANVYNSYMNPKDTENFKTIDLSNDNIMISPFGIPGSIEFNYDEANPVYILRELLTPVLESPEVIYRENFTMYDEIHRYDIWDDNYLKTLYPQEMYENTFNSFYYKNKLISGQGDRSYTKRQDYTRPRPSDELIIETESEDYSLNYYSKSQNKVILFDNSTRPTFYIDNMEFYAEEKIGSTLEFSKIKTSYHGNEMYFSRSGGLLLLVSKVSEENRSLKGKNVLNMMLKFYFALIYNGQKKSITGFQR
jgi:hypothetical protein